MPCVRAIHHPRNLGYGAALITGFKNARKDLIFYTDGDGQYDVREIHNLLAQLRPNIDLVNGYKVQRSDAWYRIWIGNAYRRAMRLAFDLSIRDVDCDFRLLRRHVFDTIRLESTSGVICVEMARKFDDAGFRMTEIPVSHYPRLHGRSQFFSVRHLSHTMKGLSRIRWNLVVSRLRMDDYRGKESSHGGLGHQEQPCRPTRGTGRLCHHRRYLDATGGASPFVRPVKNDVELVEGDTCDLALMSRWCGAVHMSSTLRGA
jgi:glycosyltransferase involved in cell wall biosynthesis